jgi:Arc/MetJ family transcription regulator
MKINITINTQLISDALKLTGLQTEREVVEEGLKTLIKLRKQTSLKELRGKLKWDGDIADMRSST